MKIPTRHPWDLTPKQAIALQQELCCEVICEDRLGPVDFVAGVDVGIEQASATARAAVAVLSFPSLELADYAIARRPLAFPYVPGLLSFREIPVVADALQTLRRDPDLLLCDGQGFAHPRRFGFASHLGVLCNLPSIGVAKTLLVGNHGDVPDRKGAWRPLLDADETIGAALRSRQGAKPVFVSIGHRVSLVTAVQYVMACVTRYRLPETTRWAHRLASGPDLDTSGGARRPNV